ncbi:MAG: PhpK family radical SAM P-methyltransferase [Myxococcota bacterium]
MNNLPVLSPSGLLRRPPVSAPQSGVTDCLVVGFCEQDFPSYVKSVRAMGEDSGAFRDLDLAFINWQGTPYRSMDILNQFHRQDGRPAQFHNTDFVWPVIFYLCTYLWRHGFSFDYVNLFQQEKDKLAEQLKSGTVRTVAITTTLYVSPQPILEIVEFIRRHDEDVTIIIGGPYVSNLPKMLDRESMEGVLEYLGGDIYVISQEGEQELVAVLDALRRNERLAGIPNIAYRDGDEFVVTEAVVSRTELARNMVNYSLFAGHDVGELVSLRTAKSCPFRCKFCGFPQRAGKYTYLDVELVERELDAIAAMGGVSTLTFIDDTFNIPKPRFKELLRMMIRNNYGFRWNCFYRSDHGDDEAIELMREAGCEGVFLGVESGSDEQLKRMNKTARRHHYMHAIGKLTEAGISSYTSLIVGFPGETEQTIRESISLVEQAQPTFWRAQLWYADPVTPIWKEKDHYNIQGEGFEWSHATMNSKHACDVIDDMFVNMKNSSWLPQWGFEFWSTFYLQRKGMPKAQLTSFVDAFNNVIKDKLRGGHREARADGPIQDVARLAKFGSEASKSSASPSVPVVNTSPSTVQPRIEKQHVEKQRVEEQRA